MAKKNQKLTRVAKLELIGGKAKPGPELASLGIDMGGFTRDFNEATKNRIDDVVPVIISAYSDRSFTFVLKTTPAAVLIKKYAKVPKGSSNSLKEKVGTISEADLVKIAEYKFEDLNANSIEKAVSMLKGQASNMGIEIEGQTSKEKSTDEKVF